MSAAVYVFAAAWPLIFMLVGYLDQMGRTTTDDIVVKSTTKSAHTTTTRGRAR